MRKLFIFFMVILLLGNCSYGWVKKQKAALTLSDSIEGIINNENRYSFKTNSKIYFSISNPIGFKSDYIKYQIIKQDDKAHMGGYTRMRNITCKVKNKNSYTDYFIIPAKGKYFIQVFDITNLQQWLAIEGFLVVD